jgi:hypothetical protein
MDILTQAVLPDLFRCADGTRVTRPADWPRRRREWLETIVELEYGGLPPAPARTTGERLNTHTVKRFLDAQHAQYRLTTGPERPFSFLLDLLIPPGAGPFPVALTGDGCWRTLTDEITLEVLRRGYALAEFNRCEIVPDEREGGRAAGLYRVHPEGTFGALSAWAWGYHRCLDFLLTLPAVDPARIAITGHSRGGKTVLLAGATDERIALTAPNNSGCGGAGCFRWQNRGSETLADILRNFPYWFGPRLGEYTGRETALPFDQHALKALVAPRALLGTEALGDLWANPLGSWQSHRAAAELFRFLGAAEQLGWWCREGGHAHGLADWTAFLDFADWRLRGRPPPGRYDTNPFPEVPPPA